MVHCDRLSIYRTIVFLPYSKIHSDLSILTQYYRFLDARFFRLACQSRYYASMNFISRFVMQVQTVLSFDIPSIYSEAVEKVQKGQFW